MRRHMDQEELVMGTMAGMARASLAQNDFEAAAGYVAAIVMSPKVDKPLTKWLRMIRGY